MAITALDVKILKDDPSKIPVDCKTCKRRLRRKIGNGTVYVNHCKVHCLDISDMTAKVLMSCMEKDQKQDELFD